MGMYFDVTTVSLRAFEFLLRKAVKAEVAPTDVENIGGRLEVKDSGGGEYHPSASPFAMRRGEIKAGESIFRLPKGDLKEWLDVVSKRDSAKAEEVADQVDRYVRSRSVFMDGKQFVHEDIVQKVGMSCPRCKAHAGYHQPERAVSGTMTCRWCGVGTRLRLKSRPVTA